MCFLPLARDISFWCNKWYNNIHQDDGDVDIYDNFKKYKHCITCLHHGVTHDEVLYIIERNTFL